MSERKLATIRKIGDIKPIKNADAIELAFVDGWQVVIKKNEFAIGDLAVYFEIDSWIPHTLAPFLSKGKDPRKFNGVPGERLRTVKLRGQLSQGLLIPIPADFKAVEGTDCTEAFSIQKWERPIPAQLAGLAKGNFPSLVPKTDQERIQNLAREFENLKEHTWSVTEKLDGSSCTFYLDTDGEFHVCSRNLDLKETETNAYWRLARKLDIEILMRRAGLIGFAIQGEMIGEGIQGNQYNVDLDFYVYDIYDTNKASYQLPHIVDVSCSILGLKTVPVLDPQYDLEDTNIPLLLYIAEGKSQLNGSEREGLVFKSNQSHNLSFKVISNKWLLKHD
jgi:RNA ligase (TIGR02306 family)